MSVLEATTPLILGGELFLAGFVLFLIFYILVRLLAERHGHSKDKKK